MKNVRNRERQRIPHGSEPRATYTNDSNHSNRVIGGKSAHADAMWQSKETDSA
jgi:hypothetical protein